MDILSRPVLKPDHRIAYGKDPSQFGDLWLPLLPGSTLAPVVVFFHGGWWKSEYGLDYAGYLCAALKQAGIASWSVEYRRVGATGGGWPKTFEDAASGLDYVVEIAKDFPVDLSRIMAMGHSAGGHLAFWNAGRHHIHPATGLNLQQTKVQLTGVIALAGAVDLRLTIDLSGSSSFAHDKDEVFALMGGRPADLPDCYSMGNPGDLLPFNIPQVLIQGSADDQIPAALPTRWVAMSKHLGDEAAVHIIPNADHGDVVDPESDAWQVVLNAVLSMTKKHDLPR